MIRFLTLALLIFSPKLLVADDAVPSPPREMRGVWIATVGNIDWPSKKGLPREQQQAELRAQFDKAVELNVNTIVLQVRPMCDALYESKLEPWSELLTGTLGKNPGYDPLAFAVKEAHVRGLELHAWFNPYRAKVPTSTSPVPENHLVKSRPDLAKPYGKHYWLNPTHKDVQDHSLAVMLDAVRRYDIDGIHMDDYFYPYPEQDADGKAIPFPDDDTWDAYQKTGGKLSKPDWRREAVDSFVERLYREVKKAKPWVKVGISPFGIWRPGNPPGIEGLDQHNVLYADARRWFNEGWVDYFTPQLYWPIKQEKQSYPKLLTWWAGENKKERHLWPGNIPSRVTMTAKGWSANEIVDQIKVTRNTKGATGNIHFSMKPLMQNAGKVADALKTVYTEPALVPASPWLSDKTPAKPSIGWEMKEAQTLVINRGSDSPVRLFVVRIHTKDKWTIRIVPADSNERANLAVAVKPDKLRVSSIDRVGVESEPAMWP